MSSEGSSPVTYVQLLTLLHAFLCFCNFPECNAQTAIDTARQTRCFVCGISKTVFDNDGQRHGGGQHNFRSHITEDHNMWSYLFFLVYLQHKEPTEFTGAESFVYDCISADNMEWVPISQALCLESAESKQPTDSMSVADKMRLEVQGVLSHLDTKLKPLGDSREVSADIVREVRALGAEMKSLRRQVDDIHQGLKTAEEDEEPEPESTTPSLATSS